MSAVWDDTPCELGEGPLWHPGRGQLFWFDILGQKLLAKAGGRTRAQAFDEPVSAAGWVDETTLLVASASRLLRFDIESGVTEDVCPLEADDPATRSNDGRADPRGGFWIGTMGRKAQEGAGAIYRYYGGEIRRLFASLTIPNAICFAPDGDHAYFADTPTGVIRRVRLDVEGWPDGEPEPWLDLSEEGWRPDGAVTDLAGNLWNAQWGGARVACYDPEGRFLRAIAFPARQTSCPAFGGDDLSTLFCTSAREGLTDDPDRPQEGMTFAAARVAQGRPEPAVRL